MSWTFAAHTVCTFLPLGLKLLFLITLVSPTSAQPTPPLHARSGRVLQVLVPARPEFKEFVECSNDDSSVQGFCIEVFKKALEILIPKPSWTDVNFTCFHFGNDKTYDTMVSVLSNQSYMPYDAVVGDATISASRSETAFFSQSYLDSGIVIVTPAEDVSQNFPGVFFAPFTLQTWIVLIVSIALTGLALWFLERDQNPYLQRTESRFEQSKNFFWFVTSILIFFKREPIKNPLAKFVMIAWILFILLLLSSYTASLSSILTVDELSSESLSIKDLSNSNVAVGYQSSSIVKDYLTVRHNISKLVPLSSIDEYVEALRTKRVVALVDEIPYISLFLAAQPASNCRFAVSSKLTIEGFGFAFYDQPLSAAFSVAILNLSESGQMTRLQDGWKLNNFECPSRVQSTRLDLKSSEGLFILLGSAMFVCIVFFIIRRFACTCWVQNYARIQGNQQQDLIETFSEPSASKSVRRWSSDRDVMERSVHRSVSRWFADRQVMEPSVHRSFTRSFSDRHLMSREEFTHLSQVDIRH